MALIPEGYYRAKAEVINGKIVGESSGEKKTPAFKLGIHITEKGEAHGMRLPWEGWLTESAVERSIEQMEIAGATFPDDPETGEPDLRNPDGVGSTEFSIGVIVEEYTPEKTAENPNPRTIKRNKTTFISRGNESRLKDMDPEKELMIARQFAGTVLLVRKKREERMAGKAPAMGSGTDFNTDGAAAAEAAERAAEAAKKAASAAKGAGGGAKSGGAAAKGKSY